MPAPKSEDKENHAPTASKPSSIQRTLKSVPPKPKLQNEKPKPRVTAVTMKRILQGTTPETRRHTDAIKSSVPRPTSLSSGSARRSLPLDALFDQPPSDTFVHHSSLNKPTAPCQPDQHERSNPRTDFWTSPGNRLHVRGGAIQSALLEERDSVIEDKMVCIRNLEAENKHLRDELANSDRSSASAVEEKSKDIDRLQAQLIEAHLREVSATDTLSRLRGEYVQHVDALQQHMNQQRIKDESLTLTWEKEAMRQSKEVGNLQLREAELKGRLATAEEAMLSLLKRLEDRCQELGAFEKASSRYFSSPSKLKLLGVEPQPTSRTSSYGNFNAIFSHDLRKDEKAFPKTAEMEKFAVAFRNFLVDHAVDSTGHKAALLGRMGLLSPALPDGLCSKLMAYLDATLNIFSNRIGNLAEYIDAVVQDEKDCETCTRLQAALTQVQEIKNEYERFRSAAEVQEASRRLVDTAMSKLSLSTQEHSAPSSYPLTRSADSIHKAPRHASSSDESSTVNDLLDTQSTSSSLSGSVPPSAR